MIKKGKKYQFTLGEKLEIGDTVDPGEVAFCESTNGAWMLFRVQSGITVKDGDCYKVIDFGEVDGE